MFDAKELIQNSIPVLTKNLSLFSFHVSCQTISNTCTIISPCLVQDQELNFVSASPMFFSKVLAPNIDQCLQCEEWRELSLDLVMADFIHMDAAVNINSTEADTMATMKVVDSNDVPKSASSFTSQISSSNLDFALNGLKLHLVQNLIKKAKIPLPLPLLCPHHTFLVSLILASKFLQNWCYSNKAWVKLSRLPPCEISCCERNCFVYHSLHILPQTQSL